MIWIRIPRDVEFDVLGLELAQSILLEYAYRVRHNDTEVVFTLHSTHTKIKCFVPKNSGVFIFEMHNEQFRCIEYEYRFMYLLVLFQNTYNFTLANYNSIPF